MAGARRNRGKRASAKPAPAPPPRTAPYPILEFDSAAHSVIEPGRVLKRRDVPEHCVVCFFQDVIDDVCQHGAKIVAMSKSEIGKHPIYEIDFSGRRLAVMHPGLGAPMGAAMLEEAIAFGCRKFVACGGAGVLDGGIVVGHLVVPAAAVRDEGTSSITCLPDAKSRQLRARLPRSNRRSRRAVTITCSAKPGPPTRSIARRGARSSAAGMKDA